METRSKKRKRQRLISIASNDSSWPGVLVPARFESLNDDTLTTILQFVGNKSYRSFGGLNKQCKEVYLATNEMTKETFLYGYGPLSAIIDKIVNVPYHEQYRTKRFNPVGKGIVYHNRTDVLEWALEEQNKCVLKGICYVAAEEGRIDLLDETWDSMKDKVNKKYVFQDVDRPAARHGKLIVLKWIDTKGVYIKKEWCAEVAVEGGHLHILQWLHEDKGLELEDGDLYSEAIIGSQLHVMKWLRQQEVLWHEYTFRIAAWKGNLNILQWLHDEGCPWPDDDYRVPGHFLKPEVIDWCRSNGHGDRISSF